PKARAAASPRPSTIEPAASTGMRTASTIWGISAIPATWPVWPPASVPCATTASQPARSACTAWLTLPHLLITLRPLGWAFFDCHVDRARDGFGERRQQVDAEGLLGEGAHLAHLLADPLRRLRGHAQGSEAASLRDGPAHARIGDAAHAGQEHGLLDVEQVADRGAKRYAGD